MIVQQQRMLNKKEGLVNSLVESRTSDDEDVFSREELKGTDDEERFYQDMMVSYALWKIACNSAYFIFHYASRALSENSARYDVILHLTMF